MTQLFNHEELMKLKGHLTTNELLVLERGGAVPLELVSRARKMLSGADTTILKAALDNLTGRTFLMFKVLEKKGLLSEDEMLAMFNELTDEVADKEKTNEQKSGPAKATRKPRRAQVFRAGTGGSIKKKAN